MKALVKGTLLALFTAFGLVSGFAQMQDPVKWVDIVAPDEGLMIGDFIVLDMAGEIDPGFHIYSSVPPESFPSLATIFEIEEGSSGIELVDELGEEGHKESGYDDIFETEISLFHDEVSFLQKFRITDENPVIKGILRYMVCDDKGCIPAVHELSFSLTAAAKVDPVAEAVVSENAADVGAEVVADVNPDPVAENPSAEGDKNTDLANADDSDSQAAHSTETETAAGTTTPAIANSPAEKDGSLWALFLKSFLAGLVAIFTPCVFPMIPLTVSVFTKQETTRSKGIRNGVFYGLSIIFIYTVLGIMLSIFFGPQVLQTIANDPWANLFFAAILFAFGLSFLGMFELTLPSSWSTAISKQSDRGGLVGIFLMALTLAVVSFSCTAPIVGAALFEAVDTNSFGSPAISMLGFSMAIALPFTLFAIFPSWLQSMPRSGGWLNSVKVVLGFLEISFALTYLSQANMSDWQFSWMDRTTLLSMHIMIFVLMGMYLLGKLRLPHDTPVERISVPRMFLSMFSFVIALTLLPGLWGAPLKTATSLLVLPNENPEDMGVLLLKNQAYAPTAGADGGSETTAICDYPNKISSHLNHHTPLGFCAFYDLDQGLAYAREHNKPVFLDFTGHTCKNCRQVEKQVWPDPEVRKMMNEDYVLISLYTDDRKKLDEPEFAADGKKLRTIGDKWLQYQIDTYRTNAQPYYVLLDHDLKPLVPPRGYDYQILDIEVFREFLRSGIEAFEK